MKLNQAELRTVRDFVTGQSSSLPDELLERAELRMGFLPEFGGYLIYATAGLVVPDLVVTADPKEPAEPVFVDSRFASGANRRILEAFRDGVFPFLLVRIEDSHECMIRCRGEVLEATCSEDKDESRECCLRLRDECGAY